MDIKPPTVKTWNFEDTHRVKQQLKSEGNLEALTYIRILEENVVGLERTLALALAQIHKLSDKSGATKG